MTELGAGGPRSQWRRIAAEGAAIVVSILLAFAIQAWWDGRRLGQALNVQLQSALGELEEARAQLHANQGMRIRTEANITALAALLDSVPTGTHVSVSDSVVTSLASYLVTELPTAQVDALLNGDFPSVDRSALRAELLSLRSRMEDQHDDEIVLRDFVTDELGPYLRTTFDVSAAQRAWSLWVSGQMVPGRTELAATVELRNMIAWKQRSGGILVRQDVALADALDRAADQVRLALSR